METGSLDRLNPPPISQAACRERLVAQTVPLLEEQQLFSSQLFDVDRPAGRVRMTVWQRHFKGVLKQRSRLEVPVVFEREGEQYDVELSCPQPFDEPRRQVFDEIKPEGRIGTTQPGQNVGQQEWANSRDHPHPQGSAERLATGASGFDEIFPLIEYAPRPLDNFEAKRGQHDPALGAVDEWGLKDVFQFLYAGTQGRLCHMTGPRRVPEMAVIGQHDQMLELAETRQVHHRLPKRPLGPSQCADQGARFDVPTLGKRDFYQFAIRDGGGSVRRRTVVPVNVTARHDDNHREAADTGMDGLLGWF